MSKRRYTYSHVFSDENNWKGEWLITDKGDKGYSLPADPVVWRSRCENSPDTDDGQPPIELREKYESLLRDSGFDVSTAVGSPVNIVEMIADEEDCAFDQPCAHGHRVDSHAVYCHNEAWLYAPRKCRRTQGPSFCGDNARPHEKCAGFLANPNWIKP